MGVAAPIHDGVHMNQAFIAAVTPPHPLTQPAYWFIFSGYRLLVSVNDRQATVPLLHDPAELGLAVIRPQYMGYCTDPTNGFHTMVGEVLEETAIPANFSFLSLRQLFGLMDDKLVWLAGRAVQLAEWNRASQFCGHCGVPLVAQTHERAKKCPQCGRTIYPRLSPAIIVLVERVNANGRHELLLAHSHRQPPGFYSVLAGFVEPGESLETAVIREINEEVGITVKNIRYFGSQPWPFPDSLMIAFTCEYDAGDIVLQMTELADAGWYTADNLPPIPPPISIARQLINWFIAKQSKIPTNEVNQ